MAVTSDDFRAALSRFPSGITVVTSRGAGGELHGITVSAFSSVSLNPPLILVCIEKTTGSHEAINQSKIFGVNILASGQDDISERFSLPSMDKFVGVDLTTTDGGIPLLADALVTLECSLRHAYDGGDHTIFVGEVENVAISDGRPLVYFHGLYRDLAEA